MPQFLDTKTTRIAYEHSPGTTPGVVFFSGLKSDMLGSKASHIVEYCAAQGIQCTRFDYYGHGQSSGEFVDGTIGQWLADALAVMDQVTKGKQILVGSSMGGWVSLLAALERPKRLYAWIGIAPAPDFTEILIWNQLSDSQRQEMEHNGVVYLPNCYEGEPYPISAQLIEEGREHLLLAGPINLTCPIRILHGAQDEDVPATISNELVKRLKSQDIELTLIEGGDHRLSNPEQRALLTATLETVR